MTITPDSLTGALVQELRTKHKVSRAKFSDLAGLTGKSTAHLYNIETKNSFKPGDRILVARVLNELETNGVSRPNNTLTALVGVPTNPPPLLPDGTLAVKPISFAVLDTLDDLDDTLATVLPAEPHTSVQMLAYVQDKLESLYETPPPNGAYRVSNSELQTFKRCRRKWWLAYYRELTLRTENFIGVRSTGTRVHRALEAWYVPDGQVRVDPRDALERVVVEDWTKISQLAAERGTNEERLTELATEFAASTNLERAMVEGYIQWLEETGVDAELRIIASETALAVDLEVDVDGEMRPVQAIGLIDARAHRVTDKAHLFIDHKTVGSLTAPVMTLPQNEQMLHYHLLSWLGSEDAEERCDGALYNMLRRVKRSAKAKPPFYERIEVRHNPYELEAYKKRMLAVTANVLRTWDALEKGMDHFTAAYPSPTPNCTWDCDFFAVCNMFDDGSPGVDDMVNALYKPGNPRERYEKKGRE